MHDKLVAFVDAACKSGIRTVKATCPKKGLVNTMFVNSSALREWSRWKRNLVGDVDGPWTCQRSAVSRVECGNVSKKQTGIGLVNPKWVVLRSDSALLR